jgi:hypothetical protein
MNWVEEKHEREQAIADGAIYLWENLCAELKSCVESYNNLYGTDAIRPVECESRGRGPCGPYRRLRTTTHAILFYTLRTEAP